MDREGDFKKECLKRLASKKNPTGKLTIRWFGMGMEFGRRFLPDLLYALVESRQQCDIRASIAMLKPDFEHLEFLNPNWPRETRKSYDALTAFAKDYQGGGHEWSRGACQAV